MGVIYKATNIINNKVYIGKTTQTLEKRKKKHETDCKTKKNNIIFYEAIRKHGFENFKWDIIDTAENEKELNEKEIYWIAEYRKTHICYNMTNGGDGLSGYKSTPESRKKISLKLKGKPSHRKGKKLPEETRKKMSESKIGNTNSKGVKHTEETKKKVSLALMGNTYSVGKLNGENNGMFGKKHKQESIDKMRIAASNRFVSQETREKMSIAQKRRFELEKNSNNYTNL